MSELALQLIEKEKKEKTGKLDLGYCGLTEIPEEVFELTWLEELVVSNEYYDNNFYGLNRKTTTRPITWDMRNTIKSISGTIRKLKNLKVLILSSDVDFDNGWEINSIEFIANLYSLEVLIINANKIQKLPDLSGLTNLKVLDIGSNPIDDLSNIGQLENLRKLKLDTLEIYNLSFFKGLNKLEYLKIHDCRIISYGEIYLPVNLQQLIVTDCGFSKISTIKNLTSLKLIDLTGNQIRDISFLKDITGLQYLVLQNNKIEDISSLNDLRELQHLNLSSNQIRDVSTLENLLKLNTLNLSGNNIDDYSFIKDLKGIQTLSLSNNKISDIGFLKELKGLQTLNLSLNKINDISSLKDLLELKYLRLSRNQIDNLSSIKELKCLQTLNLSGNQITDISFLNNLTELKSLLLRENKIKEISFLKNLHRLQFLNLSRNKISDISFLGELTGLKDLNLSGNLITDISFINKLIELQKLDVSHNLIEDIRILIPFVEKGLSIGNLYTNAIRVNDNPLPEILIKIIGKGREDVLNYFEQVEKYGDEPAYEAKILLVGDGGAGKTSLIEKLYNNLYIPEEGKEDTTLGVIVKPNRFFKHPTLLDINIKTNIWDFGGQDIQYMLHQYFLTDDSLYVLVLDNRKGNTRVDYWLRTIDSLCENGKVLVFRNNRVDDVKSTFRLDHYRNEFPNLKIEFAEANLAINDENWDNLQNLIIPNCLAQLPIVGKDIIKVWKPIREDIETNAYKNFIRISEFEDICLNHGLKEENEQQLLLVYLHVIGVALHFKHDKSLDDIIFVNPNWITKGLYAILSADLEKGNSGYIKKEDLVNIWIDQNYSSEERSYLLRLILKDSFDICYELQENKDCFVLPMKLSDQLPVFDWDNCENLIYRYRYSLFPYGMLNRIIVRLNQIIVDNLVWQEGVVIERNGSQAKIIEMTDKIDGTKNIEIRVASGNINCKKELLTIIRNEVESIHKSSYKNLKVYEMVMCNCEECINSDNPGFFELKKIEKAVFKGKKTIECRESCEDVSLVKLIGYTFDNITINENYQRLENIMVSVKKDTASIKTDIKSISSKLDNHHSYLMGIKANIIAKDDIESIIKEANQIQTQELLAEIMTYFIEFESVMDENQREIYKDIKETDDLQMKLKLGIPFGNIIGLNFEAEFDIKSWFNRMREKYEYPLAE